MDAIAMPAPPPYGVVTEAEKTGICIIWGDGVYFGSDGAQAFIDAYDPLPIAQSDKLTELAELRWRREISGASFAGVTVPTDDRSKILLAGKRLEAMANPDGQWAWKVGPGQTVTLTAAQIVGLSDAVAAHVQACFDREAVIAGQIAALTDWQAVAAFDIVAAWGG